MVNGREQERIWLIARNTLIVFVALAMSVVSSSGVVESATFYLAPNGSDSNTGSSLASPWKTFSHAISRLQAGDTLILRDGVYNGTNSGYPRIVCGANARSGTMSRPITIRAENERKAWIRGSGENSDKLAIERCEWWVIEGLRISDADNPRTTSIHMPLAFQDVSNSVFRRLLVHNNNRYSNTHLISLLGDSSTGNLFEDIEIYNFHRHGFRVRGTHNTIRRLYCNSRNIGDLPDGRPSGNANTGDSCMSIYPGSFYTVENVFAENVAQLSEINATASTIGNSFLGIITGSITGIHPNARGSTLTTTPRDTTCKDCVFVSTHGIRSASAKGTRCDNCTFINNSIGIWLRLNGQTAPGDGQHSFFGTNILILNSTNGVQRRSEDLVGTTLNVNINYINTFSVGTPFSNLPPPNGTTNIANHTTANPNLGGCPAFIRDASPLKGAGIGGRDIGANVLYAYENGVLTTRPLWDPNTKQIRSEFRGATVKDASLDTTSNSIHDFGSRLHPNCTSWPAGYGLVSGTPPAPSSVTVRAQ